MSAVAVVAPVITPPGSWQYGDPSLTDFRLSLLDRGQSDGVTRRKRAGSSRSRHSWRWSWKQMLTKPFQNQMCTRMGSLRGKGSRKKRKSESQNVSKNSVGARKTMDELKRLWYCDANESSEESSDDELSERDRRRSCYPRIFGSDSSSSDSDTELEEEHQVSEYVREGPSRIKVDIIREDEETGEDLDRISEASSQTSDSSSEINLTQRPIQGTINPVVHLNNPSSPSSTVVHLDNPSSPLVHLDNPSSPSSTLVHLDNPSPPSSTLVHLDNPSPPSSTLVHLDNPSSPSSNLVHLNNPDTNGCQNILRQNESMKRYEVVEMKRNNYEQESSTEKEREEIERNTVYSEPLLTTVSHPIAKTAHIRTIEIPESHDSTTYSQVPSQATNDLETDYINKKIADSSNTINDGPQLIIVSGQITDESKVESHNSDMNTNDYSHDASIQEVNNQGGEEHTDRINPAVLTSTHGMINNYRNGRVISQRQIYHQDILKRVDELCAQCGEEVYGRNETKCESFGVENGGHDSTRFTMQESEMKKKNLDGNFFDLDSAQEGWRKESSEKQPTKDVLPDYPSTYPKTTHYQMSSPNEEQYSKLQCEFKRFGCQFSDTSTAVEKHMQSSLNDHLKLVSKLAQDQKEQLESQQLEQRKQSLLIQQLTDTVNNLEKLVREQHQVSQSQEKTMHTLKDQMKDQRKQSQRFERDITNQVQTLNQSPISSVPTSPCVAEFVLPIRNFRKRLRRVQVGEIDDPLISEPFYTSSYGYKLSMWVYLNGRGKTLGDWVSVYARVMPSDHDNILSWPVRPMYTFTLLDQSEDEKEHIVRKRKVNDIKRDGGKHHGIHQPEGGERSVIVGFDDFVTHAQLEKRKYLVEDCLFLKIEADIMY